MRLFGLALMRLPKLPSTSADKSAHCGGNYWNSVPSAGLLRKLSGKLDPSPKLHRGKLEDRMVKRVAVAEKLLWRFACSCGASSEWGPLRNAERSRKKHHRQTRVT